MNEHSPRVGLIGTGLMGHGIGKNTVEKGFPLTIVAHRNRTPIDDLVSRGAREMTTVRELAGASDIVCLCLPGSPEVERLMEGPDGLIAGLRAGTIIVDASTSDPDSTLALAPRLAEHGVTLVDAPLSRTARHAWEGKLRTLVGGEAATLERLTPWLETWAEQIIHAGDLGDGHKMKLLNNFLSLGYGALYAEALALAARVGIDVSRFDSIIRGGRTDCGFYRTYMQYVLEGDRDAHPFTLQNACKDMQYLDTMADRAGMLNPLSNAVKNTYALAVNSDHGEDYVPMIAEVIAELNDVDLRAS
ncbi:NAD(P)-dependent oxidoreductase [Modicisalibacter radicis]|uniref:NAD(P)-dependent oxidoreductase n=1 Tax=Halomonas sp. EAR18 TaxID=2518972 RepID=UPI00109D6306|nr:NAD(P)-dependent oxidoreductase [Halomonas sp. EAR18]